MRAGKWQAWGSKSHFPAVAGPGWFPVILSLWPPPFPKAGEGSCPILGVLEDPLPIALCGLPEQLGSWLWLWKRMRMRQEGHSVWFYPSHSPGPPCPSMDLGRPHEA